MNTIYQNIIQKPGKKIAVLIDPDKTNDIAISKTILLAEKAKVDFFLIGGSLVSENPDYFMPMQFENPANPEIHRNTTAVEILEAVGPEIDGFVSGVGTGVLSSIQSVQRINSRTVSMCV